MIQFIAPSDQTWIIQNLISRLPEDVSPSVDVLSYHNFFKKQKLNCGYLIFTGLCVLTKAEQDVAIEISRQIEKNNPETKLMNHPLSFLNRYELLKTMYERGINQFRAFQIDEIDSAELSYPVFIREFGRHTGSLTDLLYDLKSVKEALADLISQKYNPRNLLVVEYCHTADETGLFRKYSAQKMEDAILPRYLSLDYQWVVKENSGLPPGRELYDSAKIDEEIRYIRENPHEEQIRKIFEIAGIDFGRIDYGFRNGRLQVWEINTLPAFGSYPGKVGKNEKRKKREESKTLFYEAMGDATRSMVREKPQPEECSVILSANLKRRLLQERFRQKLLVRILMLEKRIPHYKLFSKLWSKFKKSIQNWRYA